MYGTFGTLAAAIVTQLDSASTDGTGFAVSTLAELGLILAVISVAVNLLARLVIKQVVAGSVHRSVEPTEAERGDDHEFARAPGHRPAAVRNRRVPRRHVPRPCS